MREWKYREQIAGVENAGVDSSDVNKDLAFKANAENMDLKLFPQVLVAS